MMILMLAVAMTVTMLIATVFGLHQETQRVKQTVRASRYDRFGTPRSLYRHD